MRHGSDFWQSETVAKTCWEFMPLVTRQRAFSRSSQMRIHPKKEATHVNHVNLCATAHLDEDYAISDPESEMCLASAKLAGKFAHISMTAKK